MLERSYHKHSLSKQDLFFHLILQLLKFVAIHLVEDGTKVGGIFIF